MTHTQGPWRVSDKLAHRDWIGIYGKDQLVAEIRDPETIKLDERAIEEAMMRANATLIAAAPELMRVLQGITMLIDEDYATYLNNARDKETGRGLFDLALETLAKAEGRTP